MKKILIALDFDLQAQTIAEAGYALAKALQAQVILLHVTSDYVYYSSLEYSPILGYESFNNIGGFQDNSLDEIHKAAQHYLETTKKHLGDDTIHIEVREGDFGEVIIETAKELMVDIIVLGTHNRKGLEKIFMGSVAEKVLHHSPVPIYIIPVNKEKPTS